MKKLAALLCLTAAISSAADWLRLRTPQLEILTDAGEKTGGAVLKRLEDIQRVLAAPNHRRPPLRVLVFASEKEYRGYSVDPAASAFYQSGIERDFIVLHSGANLSREIVHEYIHWVLDRGLPLWFEEGTAELYSNLVLQRGRMIAGEPIPGHLTTLGSQNWLTADELVNSNKLTSFYSERKLNGVFYSESWALVHMLNFAPGWRENMPRFAEALASGRDPNDAFVQVFGKTMDRALNELRVYLPRIQSVSLDAVPGANEPAVALESISPVEATLLKADLALHVDQVGLARALFESAKRSWPDSPEAEAGLGTLALAENRRAEARQHFEHAKAMGSRDAMTQFQLAMLMRDSGAPDEKVSDLLKSVLDADPNFGEAHFLLGVQATDGENYDTAVDHLQAAAHAMPKRSYVWYALAFAQMKLGQTGEARTSAIRAVRTAATIEEEGMAQALLDSLLH